MSHLWATTPAWLQAILLASLYGTALGALLMLVMPLLRRSVPARWRLVLCLVVLARFVPLPLPESRLSVLNLLPRGGAPVPAIHEVSQPSIASIVTLERDARPLPIAEEMAIGTIPHESTHPPAARVSGLSAKPVVSPATPIAWGAVFRTLYLAGVVMVLVRFVVASLSLRRLLKQAKPLGDAGPGEILREVRATLGVRRKIELLLCEPMTAPAVAGFIRPRLLMAPAVLAKLNDEELRLVFLHECAHVRRRDVLLNYVFAAFLAQHWFNPVMWILLAQARAERELACDELVLRHAEDPAAYGQTLLNLFESSRPARSPVTVGMIESKTSFIGRIRMIAVYRKPSRRYVIPLALMLAAIAVCAFTAPLSQAAAPATGRGGVAPSTARSGITAAHASASAPATFMQSPAATDIIVTGVGAEKQELGKVLSYLREEASANIVVNWNALASIGIDKSTPVSFNLQNVPLRKVLHVVLDLAAGGSDRVDFDLEDDVITISTHDDIAQIQERRAREAAAAPPAGAAAHVAAIGDMYKVTVFELVTPGQNYTDELQVNEKGSLRLQGLGDVPATGLTPLQIADKIAEMAVFKGFLLPKGNGSPGPSVNVMWLPKTVAVEETKPKAGPTVATNVTADSIRERWAVGLKQVEAVDVAAYLQSLYKDDPQSKRISIGANQEDNSLLIVAPSAVMKKIREIVYEKDKGAATGAAAEKPATPDAIIDAILENDDIYKSLKLQSLQAEQDQAAAGTGNGSNYGPARARVKKIQEQMKARREEVAVTVSQLSKAQIELISQQLHELRGMMTDVMDRTITPLLNRALNVPKPDVLDRTVIPTPDRASNGSRQK